MHPKTRFGVNVEFFSRVFQLQLPFNIAKNAPFENRVEYYPPMSSHDNSKQSFCLIAIVFFLHPALLSLIRKQADFRLNNVYMNY